MEERMKGMEERMKGMEKRLEKKIQTLQNEVNRLKGRFDTFERDKQKYKGTNGQRFRGLSLTNPSLEVEGQKLQINPFPRIQNRNRQ